MANKPEALAITFQEIYFQANCQPILKSSGEIMCIHIALLYRKQLGNFEHCTFVVGK